MGALGRVQGCRGITKGAVEGVNKPQKMGGIKPKMGLGIPRMGGVTLGVRTLRRGRGVEGFLGCWGGVSHRGRGALKDFGGP